MRRNGATIPFYLYRPINDKDSSRLFQPDRNCLYQTETLRLLSGPATATILSRSLLRSSPIELIRRLVASENSRSPRVSFHCHFSTVFDSPPRNTDPRAVAFIGCSSRVDFYQTLRLVGSLHGPRLILPLIELRNRDISKLSTRTTRHAVLRVSRLTAKAVPRPWRFDFAVERRSAAVRPTTNLPTARVLAISLAARRPIRVLSHRNSLRPVLTIASVSRREHRWVLRRSSGSHRSPRAFSSSLAICPSF